MASRNVREESKDNEKTVALQAQLRIKHRRLHLLQQQAAMYGASVNPAIPIEIEDIQQDIADLERQVSMLVGAPSGERQDIEHRWQLTSSQAQIFISYKRDIDPDQPLAMRLHQAFEQAGHHIFIEQAIPLGTNRAHGLEDQIRRSDVLLALLSDASVEDGMVINTIKTAYQLQQKTGKPYILPIRINYTHPLPKQIRKHLDGLQQANWRSDEDTDHLVKQLLDATSKQIPLLPRDSQNWSIVWFSISFISIVLLASSASFISLPIPLPIPFLLSIFTLMFLNILSCVIAIQQTSVWTFRVGIIQIICSALATMAWSTVRTTDSAWLWVSLAGLILAIGGGLFASLSVIQQDIG